jgi:hypothetical protein
LGSPSDDRLAKVIAAQGRNRRFSPVLPRGVNDLAVLLGFGRHGARQAFTSATIRFASMVSGLFGRPPGLPETPGLKLVERSPPRGIASVRLFGCLF